MQCHAKNIRLVLVSLIAVLVFPFFSCGKLLGWGVLLWSSEDPPVPSGTALPVYIKSNIDKVWVAGIPREYRTASDTIDKFEVPLAHLELAGSRRKAEEAAAAFSALARTYAETLQDGLPIRETTDNNARRVYRLKKGEIIKILKKAEGSPVISAAGDPLPGDWYRVLTEDGNTGYCFSYRLNLFEHLGGPLRMVQQEAAEEEDPELEQLLARTWSPEVYGNMVSTRRINLDQLSQHWGFYPGADTGIARIFLPNLDLTFSYTGIKSAGKRSWRFEGSSLQMTLRSDTLLAVQYAESGGSLQTVLFTVLPSDIDDLIIQESARRENLFHTIYTRGPEFTSNNYGVLTFLEDGRFTWTGYNLLIPQLIPSSVLGSGTVEMRLFIASSLTDRYNGAFTLCFEGLDGNDTRIDFLYSLDAEGFRLEYAPPTNINGVTISRRASSPLVMYFFKSR
ncbi:MAG: SH3 domain-containing protein [Treponema sp.]|jgi:hypothetical protein|nr:SH3 domain-containing protein [Treponema sp.]